MMENESNKKSYTAELKHVLSYMGDILVNEFPTEILTVPYIMLSVLDVKNCHANLLLENCLMSSSVEKLRESFKDTLDRASNKNARFDRSAVIYSNELADLLSLASEESNALGDKTIGTEHVLLAVLSKKNDEQSKNLFDSVGVKYEYILSKCTRGQDEEEEPEPKEPERPKKNFGFKTTVKSGVNMQTVNTPATEFISRYTIDVTEMVEKGKTDKLIGRKKELSKIVNAMARRKKNNVILVGKSGCGLTQIVYGLAELIVSGNAPRMLDGKRIVMIDIMKMVSGTSLRGMFEERVNGLFEELQENKNYILFLDDIHNMVKGTDKESDISGMLGGILSSGDVSIIGTTTFGGYKKAIESQPQISNKLQKINIDPPTEKDSVEILEGTIPQYEAFHHVKYDKECLKEAVKLASRYITWRSLPDSAIDIIDLAGASVNVNDVEPSDIRDARRKLRSLEQKKAECLNNGDFEIVDSISSEENHLRAKLADFNRSLDKKNNEHTKNINKDDIATVVSELSGVPVGKLNMSEKQQLANLEDTLMKSVIGQDEAVSTVCKVIKRNKVGLGDKTKTMANILMVGPSGCGKTLIAKKLAKEIFGSENDLVRIDMSEYSEKSSVSKLSGAAPGYIGFENGGQLTEAVKNKQHCVLLLDEIEKAHQEVYNVFLQLFDEGRLTDSAGQTINFKNVIVIMTSNIGARQAAELGNGVGFVSDPNDKKRSIIDKEIKKKFPPEFINRIDKIVHFNYLSDENLKDILMLEIKKIQERVEGIGFKLNVDESAINLLHEMSLGEKNMGARPIIRILQENIEDNLTDLLLSEDIKEGQTFNVSLNEGKLTVSTS